MDDPEGRSSSSITPRCCRYLPFEACLRWFTSSSLSNNPQEGSSSGLCHCETILVILLISLRLESLEQECFPHAGRPSNANSWATCSCGRRGSRRAVVYERSHAPTGCVSPMAMLFRMQLPTMEHPSWHQVPYGTTASTWSSMEVDLVPGHHFSNQVVDQLACGFMPNL